MFGAVMANLSVTNKVTRLMECTNNRSRKLRIRIISVVHFAAAMWQQ